MHPQGSTDILLAAGGGFYLTFALLPQSLHLFFSHCLSITLTSFTPPNILKQLIYVHSLLIGGYILSMLSTWQAIFAHAGLAWAIFCCGNGWALLISVFTKQIEVAACPCARASSLLGAEGKTVRMARTQNAQPVTDLHLPGRHMCVCVTEIEEE